MCVVFHRRNMCLIGWASEYLPANRAGGVSFGKAWEVWPCWRDYLPRGGLKAFTASPHSQFALFALCLLLRFRLSALCSCCHAGCLPACLPVWWTLTPPSAAISQNQLLPPQSFLVMVLVQQQKSDYRNILREKNQVQIRTNIVRESTCVWYLEQAIYKDSSRWTVAGSQGDGGSELLLNGCWLFVLHYKMFRDRKHGIFGLSTA